MMIAGSPRPVHITRLFDASPEALFDAWIEPALIQRWMFRSPTHEISEVHSERQVGGQFSLHGSNGDELTHHFGEYLEIDRPRRLVFSLEVPKHFPGRTQVEVTIEPAAKGCKLTLNQTGVDRDVTENAWNDMLDTLAGLCTGPS